MRPLTWKQAFDDAQEGAKAGVSRYQTFVGYCYDIGRGVQQDQKMARYWYRKAAQNGNLDAIFNLAVMNAKGLGGPRNAAGAARLYTQAAQRGDMKSQANLALMLLDGDGVTKNISSGLQWLRRAARRGDPKAQYNLGRAYAVGDGVRRNVTHARNWLSKAAKSGHVKAKRLLRSLSQKSA